LVTQAGAPVMASSSRCSEGRTVVAAVRLRERSGAGTGGAGEVVQVVGLGLVELQGAGDRVEDFRGDTGQGAAFHLGVVVRAHARQCRHFLPAQPGHATSSAADDSGPLRRHARPPGPQELPHLGLVVHAVTVRDPDSGWGGLPVHG
jgi:hypothetical protein